ncbi:MAG: hypothetical protein ACRD0K_21735 [Egibacteraceae bacterium]
MPTTTRHVARLLAAGALLAVLTIGCGPRGLTAADVVEEINALYPTPNSRDNTHSCDDAGCVQLITTDTVSVYQWPDEASA